MRNTARAHDPNAKTGKVWIQGAGELASGVAWRLYQCGFRVIMAEIEKPKAVRRLVAFSEAVYAERAEVEGVVARLYCGADVTFRSHEVVVSVDPQAAGLAAVLPDAVIDARMLKKSQDPLPAGGVPIIGLGPGFICGRNAVYVVETHRPARLGSLITSGEAAANTGMPGPVAGQTRNRLLRAPAKGCLRTERGIGDLVRKGDIVATVAEQPVISQIDGLLRGLIHPAAELNVGEKVGDVDPRGEAVDPRLISDKALAVAGGVLEGLLRLGVVPG